MAASLSPTGLTWSHLTQAKSPSTTNHTPFLSFFVLVPKSGENCFPFGKIYLDYLVTLERSCGI